MHDEGFLRSILDNPRDNSLLLVYADWLEDHVDSDVAAKVEFLRLTAEMTTLPAIADRPKDPRWQRIQHLAKGLDAAWLSVVSRLPVEHCLSKRRELEMSSSFIQFDFLCDLHWEDMQATPDSAVRFCANCQHNVHYCESIDEARTHARRGNCVAVDLRQNRRPNDLEPVRMMLGRAAPPDEAPRTASAQDPTRGRRNRNRNTRLPLREEEET